MVTCSPARTQHWSHRATLVGTFCDSKEDLMQTSEVTNTTKLDVWGNLSRTAKAKEDSNQEMHKSDNNQADVIDSWGLDQSERGNIYIGSREQLRGLTQ